MPKKATSPSPATPPTKTLALSDLHIRLAALEKEHQSLLKKIKRKRTELKNFVEQMRSLATEIFHRATPSFQKMSELNQEIHALFKEILNDSKLSKKNRKKVESLYKNLQYGGIISPKLDEEPEDTELDELFETDDSTPPHEHRQQQQAQRELENGSATKSDQSRKIRQTFLRLAEIFHPDMVTDPETQMRHTEIMKEINKAYQEGDLARLLEIEKQHQAGEAIDNNSEDEVTRKCNLIEQQNELLKKQYEDLKRELRQVKKTPEGAMVSDCKKVKNQGIEPIEQILDEMEHQIHVVSQIRNFVRDFKQQKISIQEFMQGPPVLNRTQEEIIEDLYEQMFGDLDEFF
ncbi:MAG TPA: molecular chaperone DnaJ [Cyanobacteria bacterium UBA11369]|nr:molecular chaperone DnaJ [Cyanobacteria bacterium UBA11371]HBE35864.1 molecular chaperone DnaJ [Cyanobacteria bacterium UBA11368]HBE48534.1 molecular chaperone DnaJ [Cyanobacteria bacterium UBA11369]